MNHWFKLGQMSTIATLLMLALLQASDDDSDSVRIATYNLNWGNRQGDQIIDAIQTADADILCLQETTPPSERFLRKRLADRYPYFHCTGHQGRYGAERFAVASRIELDEVTFHPPRAGLFGFYTATFQHGGDHVRIVNVHLTPFRFKKGSGISGAMAAISGTEQQHAQEIDAIIKTIDPDKPTIIAGDFNSLSEFKAPKTLGQLGLVDTFAAVNADADTHPTWHWPTKPVPLALRIDYIFCTPHFRTVESKIIRRVGSDHSLVVSKLVRNELAEGPESPAGDE
jgi:endonuclease/exonuclease/phosphatase (EEP) superfamily protein YafD